MRHRSSNALPLYPLGLAARGAVLARPAEREWRKRDVGYGLVTLLILLGSASISISILGAIFRFAAPAFRRLWWMLPVDSQFFLTMSIVCFGVFLFARALLGLVFNSWGVRRRRRGTNLWG